MQYFGLKEYQETWCLNCCVNLFLLCDAFLNQLYAYHHLGGVFCLFIFPFCLCTLELWMLFDFVSFCHFFFFLHLLDGFCFFGRLWVAFKYRRMEKGIIKDFC